MKKHFSKASVIALMVVAGALFTEVAFVDWSLPDRVIAKSFIWGLIMVLTNHILENKLTCLRFQRQ